jgi:predicted amidophosphoribosyltransferase
VHRHSWTRALDGLRSLSLGLDGLLFPRVCPVCDHDRLDPRDPDDLALDPRLHPLHARCRDRLAPCAHLELRTAPLHEGVPVYAVLDDRPEWFALLHRVKYGGEHRLLRPGARWAAEAIRAGGGLEPGTILVGVPDDPTRRRERGFSVVGTICEELARGLGAEVRSDLLLRPRSAPSQTSMADDEARAVNLQGVLRTGDLASVAPQRPLGLVEDQVTSGATVRACLVRLGARGHRMAVLALARAARTPERVWP